MYLNKNQKILWNFLQSRRSYSVRNLIAPPPDNATITSLLKAAVRVPDHGKLEPWRFIVYDKNSMNNLSQCIVKYGNRAGIAEEKLVKHKELYENSPLMITVVSSPKDFDRIPLVEQELSCGAVCLSLLNAALASGWGATWLTGWMAHDRLFQETVLGLGTKEFVAGFIHIGTPIQKSPERPRPDLEKLVSWVVG
tara:strand:- start:157 stop:741 length:585 start_codon:yes stop_codon:yes gene_type:complete